MLQLSSELPAGAISYRAIQAAGNTWYPQSFLAPLEANEPALSSALGAVGRELDTVAESGLTPDRVVLLGFSQGGCLAAEYAARNARRYGGVVALSGGLIGPEGTPRDYDGSLDGTPALFGCSDVDPHIPLDRVRESVEVYRGLDASVDERIYEGMGHTVNDDEIRAVDDMLRTLIEATK